MIEKWICVHGHFYQPPRENAWLGAIEPQPSAHPYLDWNARITAECYRPNGAARIVDGAGRIVDIIDNYERMSFNVGPTLMAWLEREAPDVHHALVESDQRSQARFGGHGSAMAQAYNHVIMPLASPRDQRTQVRWGVTDFRHRFSRDPVGMWLPECAVDVATLEALAAEGIAFTVLAPNQARRVRRPGGPWIDVTGDRIDPGRCYRCPLPSGRSIDLFFYDGPASRAIAFEKLLDDGNVFARRLVARDVAPDGAVLCHVATDGETYGHHHRYGDMALAWALQSIERGDHAGARLTNYAQFRALFPPQWEVEIAEDTAWSCAHGIARWKDDCGCNSGAHATWRQTWRRPLRDALDWLRDRAADVFEDASVGLMADPWAARDDYIALILDRRPERVAQFLAVHAPAVADEAGRTRVLELLELQRHAMLMYTSCGWFFDDISGIETVQILQYAARVCELVERVSAQPVEAELVDRLAAARSNLDRFRDGRGVWDHAVRPSRVDLGKVAAHWAASSAIGMPAEADADAAHRARRSSQAPFWVAERGRAEQVYCYQVESREVVQRRTGKAHLVAAVTRCASLITGEHAELAVAALHLGEHHLLGGVRAFPGEDAWQAAVDELCEAFLSADLLGAQRALDRFFDGGVFSLGSLFGRERDRALGHILETSLHEAESGFRRLYDEHAPLMRYLVKIAAPVPETFRAAAELVLRHRVLAALREPVPSYEAVRACVAEAWQVRVDLDVPDVAYAAGEALGGMMDRLLRDPDDPELVEQLSKMAEISGRMESRVDLWRAQNACVRLRAARLPDWRARAAAGDAVAERLIAGFARLGAALHVYVE
ncbi:MAG: DUF3536 domain-containing protein [Kofleriaceae bacterium]|nr:DUF3536 domain-containing protein [Kofleriaceae bacterium]